MGRVHRGSIAKGQQVTICHRDGTQEKTKIKEVHTFTGLGRQETDRVESGDICAVVGLERFEIGDTICDALEPEALPTIAIDEPTMSMLFCINDSPFFGKEGKFCTSAISTTACKKSWKRTSPCAWNKAPTPTAGLSADAACCT